MKDANNIAQERKSGLILATVAALALGAVMEVKAAEVKVTWEHDDPATQSYTVVLTDVETATKKHEAEVTPDVREVLFLDVNPGNYAANVIPFSASSGANPGQALEFIVTPELAEVEDKAVEVKTKTIEEVITTIENNYRVE